MSLIRQYKTMLLFFVSLEQIVVLEEKTVTGKLKDKSSILKENRLNNRGYIYMNLVM